RVELGTDELRKVQEKKQKYLDVAGVMLVALNAAGEITLINPHGCRLLQVSEEEVLGRNWFDHFVPKRMAENVRKVFSQLMSGDIQQAKYYENSVLTSSGEERIISFHNTILTDGEGCVNGILFSGDDITERKQIEEELQRRSLKLEEANIALKILLKQCSDARQELEKNVLANINGLISPHLENLDMKLADRQHKAYVDIIKTNLLQITASFSRNLYEQFPSLTPREIQVVDFIKNGMVNKDIAELLGLSPRTVETYRDNIRIKLGIKNKRVNLRSHILSLR
ncbi:MAG: helix-turn-helix transcriptional regulator, partial [Desulfobulbaceae bacterium]|nr:helix-turn-helix transcriptional regulator [Desulfobulbaceae bacterium]